MPTVMACVERLADVFASEKSPNRLYFGWADDVALRRAEVVEMLRYKVRAMLLRCPQRYEYQGVFFCQLSCCSPSTRG